MMQVTIVAGRYARKRIRFIPKIRPTSTKVRKALFTVLGESLPGGSFLDMFAGSGAVGIEAFSRGADRVIFIEKDDEVLKLIEKNLKLVGIPFVIAPKGYLPKTGAVIIPWGIRRSLKYLSRYEVSVDYVFIDPPYYGRWEKMALKALCDYDILARRARVFLEHYKRSRLHETFCFELQKRRYYGDTCVSEFLFVGKEDEGTVSGQL